MPPDVVGRSREQTNGPKGVQFSWTRYLANSVNFPVAAAVVRISIFIYLHVHTHTRSEGKAARWPNITARLPMGYVLTFYKSKAGYRTVAS